MQMGELYVGAPRKGKGGYVWGSGGGEGEGIGAGSQGVCVLGGRGIMRGSLAGEVGMCGSS